MDLTGFLEAVTPAGTLIIAKKIKVTKEGGGEFSTFRHYVCSSHEQAAATAMNMAPGPEDIYFALASYKQGFHQDPKGKKVIRVHSNVAELKALWFDIDFKSYADPTTVTQALRGFCTSTGLPPPSILVGSGNGVHAYWPLETSVPLDRWQRLADALKEAAKAQGLVFDPVCTADAARVLRPPFTRNLKDPANPKPVKLLYSSGKLFPYSVLEQALSPWIGAVKAPVKGAAPAIDPDIAEFTGGLGKRIGDAPTAQFAEISKHCGVAKHILETHGKDAAEPEWMVTLQLLKHCEDGELWIHEVSKGHPGYSEAATVEKFEQRKANSSGPTLCSTFESHRPEICAKCPHKGFIKTPIHVGQPNVQPLEGLPPGWRIAKDRMGIERLMVDASTDPPTKEWMRVLRYIVADLKATRSIVTNKYEIQFNAEFQGSKTWQLSVPGGHLGNSKKLIETLAEYGVVFKENEGKSFMALMATWLGQLQAAKRIADVTEQLGWMLHEQKVIGFSCGQVTYYCDGRVRNDVRAAREFTAISRYYEPKGMVDPWKRAAAFLAEQNNPAFTAMLSSAFAAPLLKFTGVSGGILSVVSTASGVGKSSAMKAAQAVWGSPTHGINAVDDTSKSVARKLGFLNNLPAYWDELRGKKTVEDFLTLAFQISQGKEKTRLNSAATLQEIQTWETMLIVASNESIFDAMARFSGGSDAGLARTYEIFVDPFESTRSRAEIALMFEMLHNNYGHAGREYAQHLAAHLPAVEARVQQVFKNLAQAAKMRAAERFWFAIMTCLIVGAELAAKLGLVTIDVTVLTRYLIQNLTRLRGRSVETMSTSEPAELLASFMQYNQDKTLMVEEFPSGTEHIPTIVSPPRSDRVVCHISQKEGVVRFARGDFSRWLDIQGRSVHGAIKSLRLDLDARERRVRIGAGTKWELPPQRCIEVALQGSAMQTDEVLATAVRSDGGVDAPSDQGD